MKATLLLAVAIVSLTTVASAQKTDTLPNGEVCHTYENGYKVCNRLMVGKGTNLNDIKISDEERAELELRKASEALDNASAKLDAAIKDADRPTSTQRLTLYCREVGSVTNCYYR